MSLANEAYETLKQRIVSAQIVPGDVLSENELAADLSMSRTPIRTALMRLETEQFISIVKNRGIFVNNITFKEVTELNDIINSFIMHALSLVQRGTVKLRTDLLQSLFTQIETAVQMKDYMSYMATYFEFIGEIIQTAKNDTMSQMFLQVAEKIIWMSNVNHKLQSHVRHYTSYELAKKLLTLIEDGRYRDIQSVLTTHMENAKRRYLVLDEL